MRRWRSTRTWTRCRSRARPRSGRSIVRASAGNLKRVTLELGGKAPSIIARDADVDAAVGGNLGGALLNSGQVCAAYTRFYVDANREDEFLTKMAGAVEAMRIGPGLEETTELGPLVSAQHLDKVQQMVAAGQARGPSWSPAGNARATSGYFLQPTIFSGVTDAMSIATEEIFGPVLSVFRYADEDELQHLIERANDTPYGLAATHLDQGPDRRAPAGQRHPGRHDLGQHAQPPDAAAPMGRVQGLRLGPRDGPLRHRRLHRGQRHLDALRRLNRRCGSRGHRTDRGVVDERAGRFVDRVAAVTGTTSGIGRGIALALEAEGAQGLRAWT